LKLLVASASNERPALLQGATNMTASVPANIDEVYALIRQKALSLN
jgi:predicted house-cleaning NTP pyrophosphatase (Maf/HAM1 superfamily)